MKIGIECPKCNWEPDGGAHWQCDCGQLWDAFSTTEKCPSCAKIYADTQCPGPGPWPLVAVVLGLLHRLV